MPRLRSRANLTAPSVAQTASATRPRRGTANQPPPAAVIERSSPEDSRQSIHLTVKASPNKLRKATSGKIAKTAVSPQNIVSGKRASRNSRVIREVDSDDEEEDEEQEEADPMDLDDEEEDEDEEEEGDEEEEEEEDQDAEGEEDDDVDAEGEDDDEMEEVTPAPRIIVSNNDGVRKSNISTSKPQDTVEAREMAMADDDDDEELSELDSDEEEAEDEDAEGEDEDAEGEDDDELPAQNGDEDDDEDMDSDDGSRSNTPDLTKLTRRQRAMHVEDEDGSLMALSNEAQKKKHLTAEEHAMRRAEMARRRKNLSEKRNEEEKMDTINRLLKKQPPKRGRRLQEIGSGDEEDQEIEKANPLYVRYIQNSSGTVLGVPDEWLQGPAGRIFAGDTVKPAGRPFGGRMVEEVS